MQDQNSLYISILEAFLKLPFEERLRVLKQLISSLKQPEKKPEEKNSLIELAGTGEGIYGDIDTYIENERNWD